MRVADWMSPDPTTVPPTVSAEGAAALLRYYQVRHLPVVEQNGRLVGMISDRDLVTGVIGNRSRFNTTNDDESSVRELMSSPVLTVEPDQDLRTAVHQMLTTRVSALAVVDAEERLIGLLTSTDGLLALLQAMPAGPVAQPR